jgi:hypothetical protein
MKTDIESYTLPVERGLRFLLFDFMKTILILLSVVVINFLLIGLYYLFSKFNLIGFWIFIGLIGFGIYFIIRKSYFTSELSEQVNLAAKKLFQEKETINEKTELILSNMSRVEHMQDILNKEGLSNMKIKKEDIETLEDVPAFIRGKIVLDSSTEQEKSKISKFTLKEDEFEERVKNILFDLFIEFTNELNTLETKRVHSLEYKSVKQIEESDDRDIKKIKQLLTFLFEILGQDFFNDKDIHKNIKKLLDMDYKKTIHGKFKTHILHNPTP